MKTKSANCMAVNADGNVTLSAAEAASARLAAQIALEWLERDGTDDRKQEMRRLIKVLDQQAVT
jgi:hypothetical protein